MPDGRGTKRRWHVSHVTPAEGYGGPYWLWWLDRVFPEPMIDGTADSRDDATAAAKRAAAEKWGH